MREFFRHFSHRTAEVMGAPWAFGVALAVICLWATLGPMFHFSDTWQLVINTSTTIVTFLMVFLIQNTQNRDTRVTGLKLDELIRASKGARDQLIELQAFSDEELDALEAEFLLIRQEHQHLHQALSTVERVIKAHHHLKERIKNN